MARGLRWDEWHRTNRIGRGDQKPGLDSACQQPAAPSGRCPAHTMWLWLASPGPLPVSTARGGRPLAHRAASSHSLHPGARVTLWPPSVDTEGSLIPARAPQEQGTGASLASLACSPPRDPVSQRGWQSCGPRAVASGIGTGSKSGVSFFLPEPPPPALSSPAGPPAPAAAAFREPRCGAILCRILLKSHSRGLLPALSSPLSPPPPSLTGEGASQPFPTSASPPFPPVALMGPGLWRPRTQHIQAKKGSQRVEELREEGEPGAPPIMIILWN